MIYFDNSATTLIVPEALDAYQKTSMDYFGNPSSLHQLGVTAQQLLQQARQQIAEWLPAEPGDIVFTSGGSEGNNWVLKGLVAVKQRRHIITTAIEHPSVRQTVDFLVAQGAEVTTIPVDEKGRVSAADVLAAVRPDTVLVSVMAINNEVGSRQPLEAIAEGLRAHPSVHFHVDAVQAGISWTHWHPRIDFLTFSAHKFHGPRGCGFVYQKKGRQLAPLIHGGGQEGGQRAGTESLPAIVAMAKAWRLLHQDAAAKRVHLQQLKQRLWAFLSSYAAITLFGDCDDCLHIVTFAIAGVRGEVLVHALEAHQVYISTTSACSSRKKTAHHTLAAMNVAPQLAQCAVRISLSTQTTATELAAFETIFETVYQQFTAVIKH